MHSDYSSAPAIEAAGLSKRFGDRLAVDRVDLTVPRGTVYGLLGHNGAGKTSLIRMLLGLTHRSAGEVRLLGRPMPENRADALARVGALVEEPKFHPHLTGRENLRIVADVRGLEARERIDSALARVGLANRADNRVKSYSLGMRQRLGVARTLLADPELLILDEPSNGLDPAGIVEFRKLIRSFAEDEGRTVFLSSHQLSEVEKVCDGAAIIDRGRGARARHDRGARRWSDTGADDRLRRPRRGAGGAQWLRASGVGLGWSPPRRGPGRAPGRRCRRQHQVDRGGGGRLARSAQPPGSRATVSDALIGWELVLSPQLLDASSLGSAREALLDGALVRIEPHPLPNGTPHLSMSIILVIVVMTLWPLVIAALGARRTATRDA